MTNIKIRNLLLDQNKSPLNITTETGTSELAASACFPESYVHILQLDSQSAAVNRQTE